MSDLKILFFDIECSPALFYGYGLYDQNIPVQSIVEQPRMIAFTAKWLGKKKVFAFSEFHHSRKEMLEEMHALLEEADVVSGWNSRGFDVKWVNSEFIVEGFKPPTPYKQLDLMRESKRNFRFLSHSLNYVSQRLLEDQKLDYSMLNMWRIVNNPKTSDEARKKEWNSMIRYAKKDTALLEPLFKEMLPWLKMPHPVTENPDACHNCGGRLRGNGEAKTLYSVYERLRCVECGKSHRGTTRKNVTNVRAEV